MSLPLRFLPEARVEFDDAADYYERQRAGLGAAFVSRVQEVLDRIAATPRLHGTVYQSVRKAVVKKFPYIVFYQEEGGEILVISVFHTRRDPAVWQARV